VAIQRRELMDTYSVQKVKDEISKKTKQILDFSKSKVDFTIKELDDEFFRWDDFFRISERKKCSVLGIDVYKYSQYKEPMQSLIPAIVRIIYIQAFQNLFIKEFYIFFEDDETKPPEYHYDRFIDTGDGGFQIFNTPLHSLLFAIYFQYFVHLYNSFRFLTNLRSITGELNLRYTMTYDHVYKYTLDYGMKASPKINNYGSAIINNARILSKDKLNRFLIDEGTYEWFMKKFDGIEILKLKHASEIEKEITGFGPKDPDDISLYRGSLFSLQEPHNYSPNYFLDINLMKLGKIKAKDDTMDVYNLHIQTKNTITLYRNIITKPDNKTVKVDRGEVDEIPVVVTLGNLNAEGITD